MVGASSKEKGYQHPKEEKDRTEKKKKRKIPTPFCHAMPQKMSESRRKDIVLIVHNKPPSQIQINIKSRRRRRSQRRVNSVPTPIRRRRACGAIQQKRSSIIQRRHRPLMRVLPSGAAIITAPFLI
jgi:hypothetical protein